MTRPRADAACASDCDDTPAFEGVWRQQRSPTSARLPACERLLLMSQDASADANEMVSTRLRSIRTAWLSVCFLRCSPDICPSALVALLQTTPDLSSTLPDSCSG
jgi:hypothetical protein